MLPLLEKAAIEFGIPKDKIEEYWDKAIKLANNENPNYANIVESLKKLIKEEVS